MTKILFVEDDDLSRKLGLKVLNLFDDIEVIDVTNGYQALDLYEENKFDLLVLDLNLPDISGSEIVALIKSRYQFCPPTVLITAQLDENDAHPGNVDRVYTKPLTYDMFKDILSLVH